MCCCDKIKQFGCFSSCTVEVKTGINAPATADYWFVLDYLGEKVKKKVTIAIATEIKATLSDLNADYLYRFSVQKPDGTDLDLGVGEHCGEFQTQPFVTV